MADKTLLDTDIFSELMRAKNDTVRARADSYVEQHGRLTISVITVLEIDSFWQPATRIIMGGSRLLDTTSCSTTGERRR